MAPSNTIVHAKPRGTVEGVSRQQRRVRQRKLGMSSKSNKGNGRNNSSDDLPVLNIGGRAPDAADEFDNTNSLGEERDSSDGAPPLFLHENSESSADHQMPIQYEHLFSGTSSPALAPHGGPNVPTYPPNVDPPSLNSPSSPSVNGPSQPSTPSVNGPSLPSAPPVNGPSLPSAPSVNGPSLPSAPSINGPSLPSAPSVNGPSLPSAPSVNTPSMNIPSAPTGPSIWPPNYPPSYFVPLPTPRPTNIDPNGPQPTAPVYTRPPTTRRPTQPPTVSPNPTQSSEPTRTPQPSVSPAPTITPSPTLRPTFPDGSFTAAPSFAPVIPTKNPAAQTESPTFTLNEITVRPTLNAAITIAPSKAPVTETPVTAAPAGTEVPVTEAPVVTGSPTSGLPPTSLNPTVDNGDENNNNVCKSDEDGNFGFPTAPNFAVIDYQYQAEVTSQVTIEELNEDILLRMEKAISDVLVPSLFFEEGECDTDPEPIAQVGIRTIGLKIEGTAHGTSEAEAERERASGGIKIKGTAHGLSEAERHKAESWALPLFNSPETTNRPDLGRGNVRKDPLGLRRHRHLQVQLLWRQDKRFLQGGPEDLVGLAAAPTDQVLRGRFQNACPFPVTGNGSDGLPLQCYVIEGAVSVFGFGDLSWVDPIIQDSLEDAMGAGDFDNGAVDVNLIYVRAIPPNTTLPLPPTGNEGGENKSGGGTPAWAWVLIALGIFGLLLSLVYLTLKRRKQQEEFDRMKEEAVLLADENDEGGESDNENDANVGYGDDEGNASADLSDVPSAFSEEEADSYDPNALGGESGRSGGSYRASEMNASGRSGGSQRASGMGASGRSGSSFRSSGDNSGTILEA